MEKLNHYTKIYTITTNYLDRFDTLSPKGILDLFQDIASRHAAKLNADFDDMVRLGLIWVIARNHIKIINAMPYGEDVIVETWPLPPTRFYYDRMYQIKSLTGDVLVKGRSRWLLVDLITRRMAGTNRYTYPLESYYEVNLFDEDYPSLPQLDKKDVFLTHKVLLSEIDHNEHFNNSRYAEVVYNSIEPSVLNEIDELYIYYHAEVKLNDTISLNKTIQDKDTYLSGYVDDALAFSSLVIKR